MDDATFAFCFEQRVVSGQLLTTPYEDNSEVLLSSLDDLTRWHCDHKDFGMLGLADVTLDGTSTLLLCFLVVMGRWKWTQLEHL